MTYEPGAVPQAQNDKTTLWGVLGIIFTFCCWPLGLVFAILSITAARKANKSPVLGFVAVGLLVLALIVDIILYATGTLSSLISSRTPG